MRQIGMLTAIAALVSIPSFAQSGKNPDVDKVRTAYTKAASAGDVPALMALYANDAVVMPPNHAIVKGKAAIEAYQKEQFAAAKLSNVSITATETSVVGDLAYDAGTYSQTVTPTGGKPMKDVGKYLVLLKKQADGSWKLAYEIYNSDAPMPPPPPAKKSMSKK